MRTMPKFSILINHFPKHRYITRAPEQMGSRLLDDGRVVKTDLHHIGCRSKLQCWILFWVRKNYWWFNEYYLDENLGFMHVLGSIDIIPPKWICKLFKWN